ncbi:MAG: Methylmalonyl-CoA mutase small subunit, MutA, partial [uncultured Microvirga sp.]
RAADRNQRLCGAERGPGRGARPGSGRAGWGRGPGTPDGASRGRPGPPAASARHGPKLVCGPHRASRRRFGLGRPRPPGRSGPDRPAPLDPRISPFRGLARPLGPHPGRDRSPPQSVSGRSRSALLLRGAGRLRQNPVRGGRVRDLGQPGRRDPGRGRRGRPRLVRRRAEASLPVRRRRGVCSGGRDRRGPVPGCGRDLHCCGRSPGRDPSRDDRIGGDRIRVRRLRCSGVPERLFREL